MKETSAALLEKVVSFINAIGIDCKQTTVSNDTFLPGIDIKGGCILYEPEKMISHGDLLHEAGHIAVLSSDDRALVSSPNVNGDLDEGGAEMAAIAWSWAALKYLSIPPEIVFHNTGYKGDANSIISNFSKGRYFGVSILSWLGMTDDPDNVNASGAIFYPDMKSWLRTTPSVLA